MWSKDSVADRYEERKQAYGYYTTTPVAIPVGSRVRIDGPFGQFHEAEATVVMEIARDLVVIPDGTNKQIVIGKPAVEIIEVAATQEP